MSKFIFVFSSSFCREIEKNREKEIMSSDQLTSFAASEPSTSAAENVKIDVEELVTKFVVGGSMSGEMNPTPVTVPAQNASTSKPSRVSQSVFSHLLFFR